MKAPSPLLCIALGCALAFLAEGKLHSQPQTNSPISEATVLELLEVSSFLLGFLESVPEVAAKLKEPETKAQKFEDVVKSAEPTAVLVLALVY